MDTDFDHVADAQGWNQDSMLSVCRQFISSIGRSEALGEFAAEVAKDENEAAVAHEQQMLDDQAIYEDNETYLYYDPVEQGFYDDDPSPYDGNYSEM